MAAEEHLAGLQRTQATAVRFEGKSQVHHWESRLGSSPRVQRFRITLITSASDMSAVISLIRLMAIKIQFTRDKLDI